MKFTVEGIVLEAESAERAAAEFCFTYAGNVKDMIVRVKNHQTGELCSIRCKKIVMTERVTP